MKVFLIVIGIIALVLLVLYLLSFIIYITNADGKFTQKVYNYLIKKNDQREKEENI